MPADGLVSRHFAVSRYLSGVSGHPLTELNQRVFPPAWHGVRQSAQLNGEPVQVLA